MHKAVEPYPVKRPARRPKIWQCSQMRFEFQMLYGLSARRNHVFHKSRIDVLGLCCGYGDMVKMAHCVDFWLGCITRRKFNVIMYVVFYSWLYRWYV